MNCRTLIRRGAASVAAALALPGCAADPAEQARIALTVYAALGAVLIASFVLLAWWYSKDSVQSKNPRMWVGQPPRRRIGEWAFAAQAPTESLIRALGAGGAVRAEVALELSRRLPALTPDQFLALDARLRKRLFRALDPDDPELSLAILKVVIQTRDLAAAPHVTRLDAHFRRHPKSSELASRTALCLDVLRLAEEDPGARLLRPASDGAGEALLRPAAGSGSSEPELLLRPRDPGVS